MRVRRGFKVLNASAANAYELGTMAPHVIVVIVVVVVIGATKLEAIDHA